MKKKSLSSGLTLVELLVAISIAAILLSAAFPSLKQIYVQSKLLSYSNNLRVTFYRAQNEAIKRNRRITVQPITVNNQYWEEGWNVYLDANNNGTVDSGELITTYVFNDNNYTLKSSNTTFASSVSFSPAGLPEGSSGASNGAFWICNTNSALTLSSTVSIAYSGFIAVKEGATCS